MYIFNVAMACMLVCVCVCVCVLCTMEKRLMMRSEFLLRIKKALQQRFLYISNVLLP